MLARRRSRQAVRRFVARTASEGDGASLASYYRQPPNFTADQPWRDGRFLVLDFETTAVDPGTGHLLSMGWLAVDDGTVQVDSARHRLVRPPSNVDVGSSATIHRLTDTEVADGDDPGQVASELFDALTGRILVCHFAQLELGFLDRLCRRHWDVGFRPWQLVDTLQWHLDRDRATNRLGPGHQLQLNRLMSHYGLPATEPHHALSDAYGTALLLLAMAESNTRTVIGDLLDGRSAL